MPKIRIIQVGIGGMGDVWLRAVRSLDCAEHVAMVDINPSVIERQCARYGLEKARCFTSLSQALSEVTADAVLDITPPRFHEEVAMQAFAAGLHVLSEKPLAESPEAARRIVEQGERAGLVHMVAQNYRYSPPVQTLKGALDKSEVGRPSQVRVDFFKGPHFGGFRAEMDYPLIVDMAIHHFDMLRYLLGSEPTAVFGRSWNPPWSWFKGDAASFVLFDFDDVHVSYNASWCSNGAETPWNGNWRFECEKGVVEMNGDHVYLTPVGRPTREVPLVEMPLQGQSYLLAEFCRALTEGHVPATSGRDNLKSLEMVFSALRSFESGQVVHMAARTPPPR